MVITMTVLVVLMMVVLCTRLHIVGASAVKYKSFTLQMSNVLYVVITMTILVVLVMVTIANIWMRIS